MSETTEEQTDNVNLGEYAYQPGTKIEIDSGLFINMLNSLSMVGMNETKVRFDTTMGVPDFNKPMRSISDLGAQCMMGLQELENVHRANIESGVAVHSSEIKKEPVFEEVKEEPTMKAVK